MLGLTFSAYDPKRTLHLRAIRRYLEHPEATLAWWQRGSKWLPPIQQVIL
jgi:hypothetical protein